MKTPQLFSLRSLAILLLFVTSTIMAQSDDRQVNIGFKGGASVPNLVGGSEQEITRDYKSRLAYQFGGYVEAEVSKRFSIQTEINYAPQGGKRDGVQPITEPIPGLPALPAGSYFYANFKNTAKLHYIEIPVLFKYTWKRDGGPELYVNGGPNTGILLKATQETRGSSTIYVDREGRQPLLLPPAGTPFPTIPFDADTDVTDSLNRFNFGVTGGGGIRFPVGKNYWFVDARAAYGLTTLQKNTVTDGKSRTGNLVLSFGYAFKVKSY